MTDGRKAKRTDNSHRRHIRRTVALLAGLAAVIYLGFIARGVFG